MPSTITDRLSGVTTSVAVKPPVKAVSTTTITQSGAQTIGGVACVAGDRYLYALIGGSVLNGIWVVSDSAHTRAVDFDGSRDAVKGTLVLVAPGTPSAQFWEVTTSGTITPGTTVIAFEEHSSDELALRADLADVSTVANGDALIGWGAIYDIRDGVLTRHASLAAAVSAIGSTRCTVVVRDDVTMAASATFPSTARLWIENRARITTTGYTLTTNQTEPIAPPVQCFVGTGTVVMNRVAEVYPEWWGAVADDSTDCATAINAADAVACVGTLGLDGVTVVANSVVRFQPGTYRHNSTLTYRGAPWRGAGTNATFLKLNASSGAAVDAVGTNVARKILSIQDITFNGVAATGDTAYGLRLGYNQRSFGALRRVRIDNFPGPAIYFDDPTWSMSFYDVYCSFNANSSGSLRTAIYIDSGLAEGTLLAIDWFNLQLENNGFIGSSVGGGMDLTTNAVYTWHFYGGVWEGNYGIAEARFVNSNQVHINGLYLEAEAASVVNGLVFDGAFGSVTNSFIAGEVGMTGDGLKLQNTAQIVISQVLSNIKWINDISLASSSIMSMIGEGALEFSVASGTQLRRLTASRIALTDAATIATDAALGYEFYVTLGGNRTMGAPTNPSTGQQITYVVIQDGTGGRTLAWNAVFKVSWSDTGNTAGKRSTICFSYDGTNWNQVGAQSPYI